MSIRGIKTILKNAEKHGTLPLYTKNAPPLPWRRKTERPSPWLDEKRTDKACAEVARMREPGALRALFSPFFRETYGGRPNLSKTRQYADGGPRRLGCVGPKGGLSRLKNKRSRA